MSEHDNLQDADGKKATESTPEKAEKITLENQSETNSKESIETPETAVEHDAVDENDEEKVLNEIEESNAEDAEDEGNKDRHRIEHKEYDKMSLEALTEELEKLVKSEKVQAIKSHVENIRSEFKSKFHSLLEEKKEEFLNDGGNEIDFYYSSPIQKQFKEIYKEYRSNLNAHYKNIERNLKDNLANRLEIIEEIKGLFNVEENINTTYKHFKELQDRWKNAGPIPRDKYNNAWNSYHHHVEMFYDFLHLNRDLRDLDFKHNLEQKVKIIERAEELAEDDDHNRAFRELQALHKMWKEELGPVGKEHREEIWERFKAATKKINDKRQAYFAELDKVYEKNLEIKHEIIAKIEAIADKGANSHNAWQNNIKEVETLRNEFFGAGKVPIKVNEATWAKFKDAVRTFNRNKNAFYKDLKKSQYENLQKKLDLIKIAEDNKDSDDFDTTTPLMKKIQSDWKKIGHVPRKNSDKIWKQFKTACNHYFDKLHAAKDAANAEGNEAYAEKIKLLDKLKGLSLSGDKKTDLEAVKTFISKWKEAGNVPPHKRYIEGKLNKALDATFKKLKLNSKEAELIKFDTKLDVLNNASDSRHLDNERSFIRKKIKDVKAELNQLENNLQFFSNVNDDNPLVQDVHKNIEKHKQDLELWKTKLDKIKELY
ncbi:DUF349 domain-containing protein [Hanstruepera ponticola]|uniref:DUF349 domain-containing protein n=1 Tax=Hanstruepera ponticola TaxID=2042995 RepID=UPI0017865C8D|nr:DUF349 domain-containing protein [Hanstruepera ponticola]